MLKILMLLCISSNIPLPLDPGFRCDASLFVPQGLWVDDAGRPLVLDVAAEEMVLILDDGGGVVTRFGPRGQGPGELRQPTSICTTSTGRIAVSDNGAGKLHLFDGMGGYLHSIQLGEHSLGYLLPISDTAFLVAESNGLSYSMRIEPGTRERFRYHVYEWSGRLIDRFGPFTEHENLLLASMMNTGSPAWRDGTLISAARIASVISFFKAGKVRETAYRPAFIPVDPKAEMKQTPSGDGETSYRMAVSADIHCTGLAALDHGDLLLLRAVENTVPGEGLPRVTLVRMNTEGEALETYGGPFRGMFLMTSPDERKVYTLVEDAEDWTVVRVVL